MAVPIADRPARSSSTGSPPPTSTQQYRKRVTKGPVPAQRIQLLSGSRLQQSDRLDFAVKADYNAEAQVMGMATEGVDIAVLYPTMGLGLLGRNGIDPRLSLAVCQAYNNWIHEFCSYSPERLKFVAMLPMHDIHLACRELKRNREDRQSSLKYRKFT